MVDRRHRLQILIEAKNQTGRAIREVSGGLDKISGLLMTGGFAFAGAQFLRAAFDLAELGAQADRTEASFRRITGSTEKTDQMLAALRRTSQGTISDMNLMLIANRAMMGLVTDDAEVMSRLLEVAIVRGRALGRGALDAFNDVITGIARMQPLILDNLMIITGGKKVYEDYAQSIDKTAEALTAVEKRQALVNLVLRDHAQLIDDSAASYEYLAAQIENVKREVGKLLELSGFIDFFARGLEGLALFVRTAREAAPVLAAFHHELEEMYRRGEITRKELGELRMEAEVLRIEAQFLGMTTEELVAALYEIDPAAGVAASGIGDLTESLGLLSSAFGDTEAAADSFEAIAKRMGIALVPTTDELERIAKLRFQYALGIRDEEAQIRLWEERIRQGGLTFVEVEEAKIEIRKLGDSIDKKTKDAQKKRLQEQLSLMDQTRRQAIVAMDALISEVLRPTAVTEMDMLRTKLGLYTGKWDEAARRLEDIAARGLESPWAAQFEIPVDVLAKGPERIKLWAMEMADAVRTGLRLDLVSVEALDEALRGAFERKQGREALTALARERVAALGLGLTEADITVAIGAVAAQPMLTMGGESGQSIATGMKQVQYGSVLIRTLELQIKAEDERIQQMGVMIGTRMVTGMKESITPDATETLVGLFGPTFAQWLKQKGYLVTRR